MRFFDYGSRNPSPSPTFAPPQVVFLLPSALVIAMAVWAFRVGRFRPVRLAIGLAAIGVAALLLVAGLFAHTSFHGGG
jgi:hypothetical protein